VQDLRELFMKAYSEHDSSLLRGLCKGPLTAFKALDGHVVGVSENEFGVALFFSDFTG
jgi:hypothetical protein